MHFIPQATPEEIKKERQKARELRASAWWKRKKEKGVCHFCGRQFKPGELTMEHVVPLARGGKSTKANLVPCCKECNNRKKYLLPLEWEDYLKRLAAPDDDAGGQQF
ncbi:MAG: HNH endonuclease [Nitrospiraceae bacterium]|nr:HNH endonuclease [Nitrospiraceae bacterium]